MRTTRMWVLIAVGVFAAADIGCSSGTGPGTPSSNVAADSLTGGGASASGTLSIRMTDSPFSEARALLVTFSDVSVHRADPGEWKTLPFVAGSSRTCDLKQLHDATNVLGVGSLAAGKYTQIRLNVASAAIYFDNAPATGPCAAQIPPPPGASAPVVIPSGEVKLNNEFTLSSTGTTILLDFDGDRSVHQTGSGNGSGRGSSNSTTKYMMVPVIRVVSVE